MANECDSIQNKYSGDGTRVLFPFTFPYMSIDDIECFIYNEDFETWENQADKFIFANATTVEFLTPPPAPTTTGLANVWITRNTDIEKMIATFYPGSSIRAQDLNDDFDQIRLKQQEIECEFERFEEEIKDDVVLKEELFDRPDQESGKWSGTGDQEYVATSGAIAARHDAYVQDTVPAKPAYEQPGKGWHNTGKMWDSHWDPSADKWVAYVNTGPRGVQGPQGIQGPVGPPGEGVQVIGSVPNFSDLPTDLGVDDLQFWYVETENILYFWNGSRWDNAGAPGGTGPQGEAATIAVGTTSTGGAGTAAQVTNSGTSSEAVFDFIIPRGDKGDDGQPGVDGAPGTDGAPGEKGDDGLAATLNVGTTTTGAPGSDAEVINTGTPSAAVFNFTIPRGDKGDKGDAGVGIQYKGVWDQADTVPSPVIAGDLYAWVGASGVTLDHTSWGAIDGSTVDSGDRLAYTSDLDWSIVPAPDTQGVAEVSSSAPITVNNSNPAHPIIGFNSSGYVKTGNNVSVLTNDAGYITAADIPSIPDVPVTSVNGKTGAVVLNAADVGAAPSSHVGGSGTSQHPLAVAGGNAGFMSGAQVEKLSGIQTGAQVNVGTNLARTRTATENTITSSTGTNATLTAATGSDAGLMTAADKNKLNGIGSGATVTTVSAVAPCVSNGSTTTPIISFNISLLQDLP